MPDAKPPDWRNPGTSASSGPRAWQTTDTPAGEGVTPLSRRSLKRTISVIALVGIAVGIGVIISLLRAQRPACLVVIGSGYEQNLLLPHNVHGWNGAVGTLQDDDIAELEGFGDRFRYFWDQPTKMRRLGTPVELADQTWSDTWDKIAKEIGKGTDQENVVLFFSMHGYADDSEAYLLRNAPDVASADSFQQARIPFRDLLKSLKDVKDKNVVVLLDVCHVQAHWLIGMLHNDFAERLKGYEKDIDAMGNVTVICSAGPNERSWDSDEEQTSAFAYFVRQGLKGAGQKGLEKITALKLFKYVEENVNTWARINRARSQMPFLLGEQAAERTELVRASKPYEKPKASDRALASSDVTALTTEWNTWKRLKRNSAPQVHSPHFWRLYQETLLRYEQLMRGGDPTGKASELKKTLDGLAADIEKARSLSEAFACLGNSFPIHRVLGFQPKAGVADSTLDEYLRQLRRGNIDEKNKVLDRLLANPRDDRQYWQTQLSRRMLLADLSEKQDFVHAKLRKLLTQLAQDLNVPQRAAEVHLLKLLDQLDPAFDKLDDKAQTVRQAVRVRMLAEEVALSLPGDALPGEAYAEAIFPGIRTQVKAADGLRREAEDALFAAPGKMQVDDIRRKFNAADQAYRIPRAKAQRLRTALALRDDVSAELPFFAASLASLPAVDNQAKSDIDALLRQAAAVGVGLGDLNAKLEHADAPSNTDRIAKDLTSMREGYQQVCNSLAGQEGKLQKNWHALDGALSIPPMDKMGDVPLRITLLTKLRELSAELNTKPAPEKQPAEDDEGTVERQRAMLAACVKPYQIKVADKNVDDKVRDFFLKLPDQIKKAAASADEKTLAAAASECRVIPAGLADRVRDKLAKRLNPVERLRRLRTSDLLVWLAERTANDHWFEPDPKADKIEDATFYVPVAKAYVDSAAGIFKERPSAKAPTQMGLALAPSPNRYWTTEATFTPTWQVRAEAGVPAGMPEAWLEVLKGSKRAEPWQMKPREPVSPWPTAKPFAAAFELKQRDFVENSDITVAFHALYRGQHLIDKITIQSPAPDVIVRHTPGPEKVGFAARMATDFDYGAISIVLDNSGSMKLAYPVKKDKDGNPREAIVTGEKPEKRRFDYALEALDHVLSKVPDKTKLTIFALGREKFAGEREDVQGVIRLPVPAAWWQDRAGLLARLKWLPANLNSPIGDGIVTSMKEGFPSGHTGPKIILVLTDGDDNASFGSSHNSKDENQIRRHTQKVVDELEEAHKNHPDVHIIVVCFIQKDDPEYNRAGDQFRGVEQYRPSRGAFKRVPNADDLGTTIEELMRPRVQLTKKSDGIVPPGFKTGRPVTYLRDILEWKPPMDADNYLASIYNATGTPVDVEMRRGNNIFAVLKRNERTLVLERAILANQPEVKNKYTSLPTDPDGWSVTLLENHRALAGNSINQVVAFEKTDAVKDLRQFPPGLVWLDLDPVGSKRADQTTLEWTNVTNLPAPAFRLKMPWAADQQPRLTAWFWPHERKNLLENDKLVSRRKVQIPHIPENANDPIESIHNERRKVGAVEKDCLVIQLRYPERKPVFVLPRNYPQAGAESRYYLAAGRGTVYVYDVPPALNEIDLAIINIDAFQKSGVTRKVEFTPDRPYEVPANFRFQARE